MAHQKPIFIKTGKSYSALMQDMQSLANTLNDTFPLVTFAVRLFGANGMQVVGESSEPGIENIYSNVFCCDKTKVD